MTLCTDVCGAAQHKSGAPHVRMRHTMPNRINIPSKHANENRRQRFADQHERDIRFRRALSVRIKALEREIKDDIDELEACERHCEALIATVIDKQEQRRQLSDTAWRLTGRIERREVVAA